MGTTNGSDAQHSGASVRYWVTTVAAMCCVLAFHAGASPLVVTGFTPAGAGAGEPVQILGTGFGTTTLEHRALVWRASTSEGVTLTVDGVGPGQLDVRVGPDARPMVGTLIVAKGLGYNLPSPQLLQLGARMLWVQDATWFRSQAVAVGPEMFTVHGDGASGGGNAISLFEGSSLRVNVTSVFWDLSLKPEFRLTVCNHPNDGGPPPPPPGDVVAGFPCGGGWAQLTMVYDAGASGPLDAESLAADVTVAFNQNFAMLGLAATSEGADLVVSWTGEPWAGGFAAITSCNEGCN